MDQKRDNATRDAWRRDIVDRLVTRIEDQLQTEDRGGQESLYLEDEDTIYVLLAQQLLRLVQHSQAHHRLKAAQAQLRLFVNEALSGGAPDADVPTE